MPTGVRLKHPSAHHQAQIRAGGLPRPQHTGGKTDGRLEGARLRPARLPRGLCPRCPRGRRGRVVRARTGIEQDRAPYAGGALGVDDDEPVEAGGLTPVHGGEVISAPVVPQSCEIVAAVGAQALGGHQAAERQIVHHERPREGEHFQSRPQRHMRPPQAERIGEDEAGRLQTTQTAPRRCEQQIAASLDEDAQLTVLRSAPQNPGGAIAARTIGDKTPTARLTAPDACGPDQLRASSGEGRNADHHPEEGRRQGGRRHAGQQKSGIAYEVEAQIAAARGQRHGDDEEPAPVRGRAHPRQAPSPRRSAPGRDAASLRSLARERCRGGSHADQPLGTGVEAMWRARARAATSEAAASEGWRPAGTSRWVRTPGAARATSSGET